MKQKHKNAEYTIAFANGEEVEWKNNSLEYAWDDWRNVNTVGIFECNDMVFRMKPKTVTTKGYKRYAWQDGNFEWCVDTFSEGEGVAGGCVVLDKEWQYHVIEEKE